MSKKIDKKKKREIISKLYRQKLKELGEDAAEYEKSEMKVKEFSLAMQAADSFEEES